MIHPTAVIDPKAQIDPSADVGPYAVIDAHVSVGPQCKIGPHVYLTGHTQIGASNVFHAGSIIGDEPQDLKYADEPTRLRIGDHNVFREHVTVHRSNKVAEDTLIGSHNLFMANCHIGHNSVVGNHVIIANGALFGGHVHVDDRAFISGNCLLHQFVRVGTLALMQGGSAISKDLPPFTIARGINHICGLNTVGLRRAGLNTQQRLELRRMYHQLFRTRGRFKDILEAARREFSSPATRVVLDFISAAKRGVCSDIGGLSKSEDAE